MLVFMKWSMIESGNTTIPSFPRAWDKRSLIIWYWSCTIATWKACSKRHFIFKGKWFALNQALIQCSATSGRNSVYVNTPIDSSNQLRASFLLCQLEALKKASCSIPLIWPLLDLLGLVGTDPAFQTEAASGNSQWLLQCICLSIDMSLHHTNITLSLVLLDWIPTVTATSTFFHANLVNWQLTPDFLW